MDNILFYSIDFVLFKLTCYFLHCNNKSKLFYETSEKSEFTANITESILPHLKCVLFPWHAITLFYEYVPWLQTNTETDGASHFPLSHLMSQTLYKYQENKKCFPVFVRVKAVATDSPCANVYKPSRNYRQYTFNNHKESWLLWRTRGLASQASWYGFIWVNAPHTNTSGL